MSREKESERCVFPYGREIRKATQVEKLWRFKIYIYIYVERDGAAESVLERPEIEQAVKAVKD